jgi:MoxR-like ATPase
VRYIDIRPGTVVAVPSPPGAPTQVHVFDEDEITALNTALAARRALLVRGEPGTGKTQLAHAAAVLLKRPIVTFVVDARSEARDLLWHLDAVRRLADAQVYGALLGHRTATDEATEAAAITRLRDRLDVARFIQPRALWWALDWAGAATQARLSDTPVPLQLHEQDPANGVVVLIDEIDKGEADVPNGLLEALGTGEFTMPGAAEPVRPAKGATPPLVVITTNEERTLPDAFVRRCIVLTLRLPVGEQRLVAHLVERGRAHFGRKTKGGPPPVSDEVLTKAALLLARDRQTALDRKRRPLPGQAEFLDLVRAVIDLAGADSTDQQALLEQIAPFALRKHAPETEPEPRP